MTSEDLIRREDALACFHSWIDKHGDLHSADEMEEYQAIEALPSAQPESQWIPVKWHEITEEEREREGYSDWAVLIDCEMPCDEQEILVQTKSGYVRWDVCYEDGEFSLDSGWDWIEDIVAWMPLPEPWKGADMRGGQDE